ncbi:hypothetical protein EUAN_17800 [Andreesenia angusta]|uniref:Uncharacterized protein n=1 Tax=Andreesenia angusta TaxID=39480 RepID=A0A1S1V6M3_9FIRM|nr:hypothetical protein EUAN_17800 [Andreesenia angusta]
MKYEVDGINVYIERSASHDDEITIKMAEYYSDMANKEFWVDGVH